MSSKTAITMRRYTYGLLLITSLILGGVIIHNASAYVIDYDNDSVWVEGNYSKLEAYPHTLSQSGWVYFNITPYQDIGNIDMYWGFNTSEVKPKKAEWYHPHWINWTTDHEKFFWNVSKIELTLGTCNCGNEYNKYKRNVTYQIGYDNVTNESITTAETVCFDSYNQEGSNYTVYWHTNYSRLKGWVDVTNKLNSINYDYDGKNKWWSVTNFATEVNKTYTGRIWINVPVTLEEVSGKYDFAVKRTSDTLHDAISNNRFYLLDPWFSSSWSTRRDLNINCTGSLNYYQMNLNLSYSDMPTAQADFEDIRFVNVSDGASLPCWVEDKVDGEWCNFWVNVTSLHAGWNNDTMALYYGNECPTTNWDGAATFSLFDDFNRADSATVGNGWTQTGDAQIKDNNAYAASESSSIAKDFDFGTGLYGITARVKKTAFSRAFSLNLYDGSYRSILVMSQSGSPPSDDAIGRYDGPYILDPYVEGQYYILQHNRVGSNLYDMWTDGDSITNQESYGSSTDKKIDILLAYDSDSDAFIDWVFIRKYAANPPTYEFAANQYFAGSIHYNTTNPYSHTIESDGTITANRSIITTDDINWAASAVSDDCGLLVTQFDLLNNPIANFTVYDAYLDWLRVTNLTVGRTYALKNSSGTVEAHGTDAIGEINYTTDLIPGSYWILLISTPAIIDTNYTITGNDALILFSNTNTIVTFTATSNQTISYWYWTNATYIDGNGTASSNASHYYGVNGTYYVTVRGENVAGNFTDTITWQINVGGTGGGTANGTYALIGTAISLGARKTTMASAFVLLSGMFMMMLAKRYKEDEQDVT